MVFVKELFFGFKNGYLKEGKRVRGEIRDA
jgi:hypothetical protein